MGSEFDPQLEMSISSGEFNVNTVNWASPVRPNSRMKDVTILILFVFLLGYMLPVAV